jgi:two-component sensor histidine kinase
MSNVDFAALNVACDCRRCQEDVMTDLAGQQPVPQEQILLHELIHRINNEFTAVISVVSLAATRSGSDDVKAALSQVSKLLQQYVDVHRALQMPEHDGLIDAAAYLRQLCRSIGRSQLRGRNIKLIVTARPLRLSAQRCWRMGMIVFELINNAARHAFGGGRGTIRVELSRETAWASCSVTDDGLAAATARPGRGLKIIEALSKSLCGRFAQEFGSRGSRSIVVFPCNDVAQAGGTRRNDENASGCAA